MSRFLLPALLALGVSLSAVPAAAQVSADSAERSITIPVPENGVIYLRSGEPGGVRIRSRRAPNERAPSDRASGGRPIPADDRVPGGAARDVDLERLAAMFDRLGLDLYGEPIVQGDRLLIVLRDSLTGAPADTLLTSEAVELVESFAPPARDMTAAPGEGVPSEELERGAPEIETAEDAPLAERIERTIFDLGVFRSLQVNFAFDESDLLPSAYPTLDAVVDVLESLPSLEIEVSGHTDAIGTDPYNAALSLRRAESVRAYLTRQGIGEGRLTTAGYGESRPILSNETRTGRALNRRVEFRLTGGTDSLDDSLPPNEGIR